MIDLQDVVAETCGDHLVVTQAPARTLISSTLYEWAVNGDCHRDVSAGEGLLVIHAANGTYRYALDALTEDGRAWTAHRI